MAAPLRIQRPYAETRDAAGAGGEGFKFYVDRLVKLIPAEVLGLYLIGVGLIPTGIALALAVWAAVCTALVIFARAYATADPANKLGPQWAAVAVSTVSFILWLYSMGGPFEAYGLAVPWLGSLAILVWTFLVPYFYKGESA